MTVDYDDYARYNTSQVAAIFSVSVETIRLWCEEFQRHLSPTASPGKGKHRSFTIADLEIVALVAELKNQSLTFRDIHAALDNGQRGSLPDLSPDELRTALLQQQEGQVALEIRRIEQRLVQVEQERDRALDDLKSVRVELDVLRTTRDENIKLKSDLEHANTLLEDLKDRVTQAEQRITDLIDERAKLEREAGEAYVRGAMDVLRKRGDLPE